MLKPVGNQIEESHQLPPIYLDYHSTTPVDSRVVEKMVYYLTTAFGNASSVDHSYGDEAEAAVKKARRQVADLVGASPVEVIFTSGATESINIVLQGSVAKYSSINKMSIAVSPIEHKAVLDTCEALVKKGIAEVILLLVDSQGRLDMAHLERVCAEGVSLLCVMAANNEIGNIYPIQTIGEIAQKYQVPFLCDASQAVGKFPLSFKESGITYLTLSGHKIYGPKGVGALITKKGDHLEPLIFGGGHQQGLRSGTLNVPGIVALGEACHLRHLEMETDEKSIALKRDKLQSLLRDKITDLVINGDVNSRLAGNLHISLPGIPNTAIIARVRHRLAISTGAACSSGTLAPSHVLVALNLPKAIIQSSLRIGLGKYTTDAEIEIAAHILVEAVQLIQQYLKR